MPAFSQDSWACRCEWGPAAVTALAPADVTVVVDVFSFTTCVDVAVSRGATILPYTGTTRRPRRSRWRTGRNWPGVVARRGISLAPASSSRCARGSSLRAAIPEWRKGRACGRGQRPRLHLAGCLRNARAVADAAARLGHSFNVIPAGERWPDGSLRPALEDWLGAGAILLWLPGSRSPEADAAVMLFERHRETLVATLQHCGSGRELEERGHEKDKAIAGELDVSSCVPRFDGLAFVAAAPSKRRKGRRRHERASRGSSLHRGRPAISCHRNTEPDVAWCDRGAWCVCISGSERQTFARRRRRGATRAAARGGVQ